MNQVLADLAEWRLAVAQMPPDMHLYYARVESATKAIDSMLLADRLRACAETAERDSAEQQIAFRLAQHIDDGSKRIDLSQRYLTSDPDAATARHEKALERLDPFLREARTLGLTVERGQAIAVAAKHVETLAIATGIGA